MTEMIVMKPQAILNYFNNKHYQLLNADGKLRCIPTNGNRLTDEERALIINNKQALLKLVSTTNVSEVIETAYPLMSTQSGLLFHVLQHNDSDQYQVQLYWHVKQKINTTVLKQSWQMMIDQHSVLRTQFSWDKHDQPIQVVHKKAPLEWQSLDWSEKSGDLQKELQQFLQQDRKQGFDFSKPSQMRVYCVLVSESHYILIWSHHHIILDGWSVFALLKQLENNYTKLLNKEKPDTSIQPSYQSFIQWLDGQNKDEAKTFWKHHLNDIDTVAQLPLVALSQQYDYQKTIETTLTSQTSLNQQEVKDLNLLSKQLAVSVNAIVQFAWSVVLNRNSDYADKVVYGMVSSGRSLEYNNIDKIIGLMLQTLPVNHKLHVSQSVAEQIQSFHQLLQNMNAQALLPLSQLQQFTDIEAPQPLFTSLYVFENYPVDANTGDKNLPISEFSGIEKTHYPLVIMVLPGDTFTIKAIADSDYYNDAVLTNLLGQLRNMILEIIKKHAYNLHQLNSQTPSHVEQLIHLGKGNDVPVSTHYLHQWVEHAAMNHPNKTAIISNGEIVTYRQLNLKASALANKIHAWQADVDCQYVGIYMQRGIDYIVALLAILKSGLGYVPLSLEMPINRLDYIANDVSLKLILTDASLTLNHNCQIETVSYSELPEEALLSKVKLHKEHDPAYIIYTSGSTGQPKGVVITHKNVCSRIAWLTETLPLDTQDVLLQNSAYTFDMSVSEIFWPLASGSAIVVSNEDEHKDINKLMSLIRENQVNILHFVPSAFNAMISDITILQAIKIKYLFLAGEPLQARVIHKVKNILPHTRVFNMYGPTETTIYATWHECSGTEQGIAPIGRATPNTRLYVISHDGQLCAKGVSGELVIAGDGVSDGYVNLPDKTNEQYKQGLIHAGETVYLSGDIVRWNNDGNLDYIGRKDNQVKIRGYRIELEEIESQLLKYQNLSQCAVDVRVINDEKMIVAYYVSHNNIELKDSELRYYLAKYMPSYMLPSHFIHLEKLRLTQSGKIDKVSLQNISLHDNLREIVMPRSSIEQALHDIWSNVLCLDHPVGIDNSFFHIGGHSLTAARVIMRIKSILQLTCDVGSMFNFPTIREFIANVINTRHKHQNLQSIAEGTPHLLAYNQIGLWFFDKYTSNKGSYNVPMIFSIENDLDIEALQASVNSIIAKHDVFRSVFEENDDGEIYQKKRPYEQSKISIFVEVCSEKAIAQQLDREIHKPFNLTTGPLLRLRVFKDVAQSNKFTLVLVQHHIITDGWSCSLLLKELGENYNQFHRTQHIDTTAPAFKYTDYTAWEHVQLDNLQDKLNYWQDSLKNCTVLNLPTDKPRPPIQSYVGEREKFVIESDLLRRIKKFASQQNCTLHMMLLAAYKIELSYYAQQNDIVVGVPIANRTLLELEEILGFFVNSVAIRTNTKVQTVKQYLQQVRKVSLQAYSNQDLPLSLLLDKLGITRDRSQSPLFQATFVLQSSYNELNLNMDELTITEVEPQFKVSKFDMTLDMVEKEGELIGSWEYSTDLFRKETIRTMIMHYKNILSQMIAQPDKDIQQLMMLTRDEYKQIVFDKNNNDRDFSPFINVTELAKKIDQINKKYTIGVSGGEIIANQPLMNSACWMKCTYDIKMDDRFLIKPPYNSNRTVTVLLSGLIGDAQLVFADAEVNNSCERLLQFINNEKITRLSFTPSKLHKFVSFLRKNNWPKLTWCRDIFCNGEALAANLANIFKKYYPDINLHNLYNAAKVPGFSAYNNYILATNGSIPIGCPIDNVSLYVLSASKSPIPIGSVGELYVGVDDGAEESIKNPFQTPEQRLQKRNGYLYKTGDRARFLSDGNIEYIGKQNQQIIRQGFQITPAEIVHTIQSLDGINQVVVSSYEDTESSKALIAYYTCVEESSVIKSQIEEILKNRMPAYMLPTHYIQLEQFHLTNDGKIDRNALPNPQKEPEEKQDKYAHVEQSIKETWCKVLNIDDVGVHDDFFSLGGDSILSIQMIAALRKKSIYLTVQQIFDESTIAGMARVASRASLKPAIKKQTRENSFNLIPIQKIFFEEKFQYPHYWNQSVITSIGAIDEKRLRQTLDSIVKNHDTLRIRFKKAGNKVVQYYANEGTQHYVLKIFEHKSVPELEALQKEINFEKGPIMVVGAIKHQNKLFIAVHHLLIDGVSWRILLSDIESVYKEKQMIDKSHSLSQWQQSLVQYTNSDEVQKQHYQYWKRIQSDAINFILPYDTVVEVTSEVRAIQHKYQLPGYDLQTINAANKTFHTNTLDLLLAGFCMTLSQWSNQQTIAFRGEGHGRENIDDKHDYTRTLGWFTSVYPIAITLEKNMALSELVIQIKETVRSIPKKGLSYGLLSDKLALSEIARVCFNYLGMYQWSSEDIGHSIDVRNKPINDISFDCYISNSILEICITYDTHCFLRSTIEKICTLFNDNIKKILNECLSSDTACYTPSDFPLVNISQHELDEISDQFPNWNNKHDILPLAPSQQGILLQYYNDKRSNQYNTQIVWEYHSPIDKEVLKQAWRSVIDTYDSLRSCFYWGNGDEPLQIIVDTVDMNWSYHDLSDKNEEGSQQALHAIRKSDYLKSSDLSKPGSMRFILVKLSENNHHFIWSHHHALLDGWSVPLIFGAVHRNYKKIQCKQAITHDAPLQNKDYLIWLLNQDKAEALQYWSGQVSHITSSNDIVTKNQNSELDLNSVIKSTGTESIIFDEKTTKMFSDFVKHNKHTLSALLQMAWSKLLHIYSGGDKDITYGSVVSGRAHVLLGIESMVGLCINTLPIVMRWSDDISIRQQLQLMHKKTNDANRFSFTSLSEIKKCSKLTSDNLFNSLFVFENYPDDDYDVSGLIVKNIKGYAKNNFPLVMRNCITNGKLSINLIHDEAVFNSRNIKQMLNIYHNILFYIADNIDGSIQDIAYLNTVSQKQILYDWNNTSVEYQAPSSYIEYFKRQVIAQPEKVALSYAGTTLTYLELDQKSDLLAHHITNKVGQFVPIYFEPSIEMIVSIFAIMKTGAAYVPIDSEYPVNRVNYILKDIQAKVLLSHKKLLEKTDGIDDIEIITAENIVLNSAATVVEFESHATINDVMYVIYTSGTTGKPKGVMVTHANVINYTHWMAEQTVFKMNYHCDMSSSIAFDATVQILLFPLSFGMTVHLCSKDIKQDPTQYIKHLVENNIDVIKVTPSYFKGMLSIVKQASKKQLLNIKTLVIGGEAVSKQDLYEWQMLYPNCKLLHHYGPTETTVGSLIHLVDFDKNQYGFKLPLGKPQFNIKCYVLDEQQQPLPIDIPGELYIGGACVSKGYLHQPHMTQEKYIQNPFAEGRLYKTGDIVCWRADGNIEYIGRKDFQIKVRGFRIEIKEIEITLLKFSNIKDCVVIADAENQNELVAYYMADDSNIKIDTQQLREYILNVLPHYMLPNHFIQLDQLPLNVNGKLDRSALPKPQSVVNVLSQCHKPRDKLEQQLQEICLKSLKINKIGINDDFFQSGGDSIKLIRMIFQIEQKLLIKLSVKTVINNSSIAKIAQYIRVQKKVEMNEFQGIDERETVEI